MPVTVLKKLSLDPDDIHYVINTHFHYDHCGFNSLFKNAVFFVQKSHYEYALNSREEGLGLTERYRECQDIDYHLVDGDRELVPGITVIKTDGHMTGIQSVVIALKNTGKVLLTSDAMRDSRMLHSSDPVQYSMFDNNEQLVNDGVRKLKKIIEEMDVKLII